MGVTFLSCVLAVIMLGIVPFLMGNGILGLLKKERGLSRSYVFGFFLLWAFIQLIAVPLILLKASYDIVAILIGIYVFILSLIGILKRKDGIRFEKRKPAEIVFLILLLGFSLFFMYLNVRYQHIDEDDSRFIANAADILNTHKLFLTNPANGNPIEGFVLGDSDKDVCSPWSLFYAFLSSVTMLKPVVFAHSVLPLALILLSICVWWLLAEKLLGRDIVSQCMFVILVLLIHLFGYSHLWTQVTMYMDRLWQGKAVVSSIGIPALFVSLVCCMDESDRQSFLVVLITDMGICLMSGMGIVIAAIIIGCFAAAYAAVRKDMKMLLLLLAAIPNAIYFLIEINI